MSGRGEPLPWGMEIDVWEGAVTATCEGASKVVTDFFNEEVNGFTEPATGVLKKAIAASDDDHVSDTYGTNIYQFGFDRRQVTVEDPFFGDPPVTVSADDFVTALTAYMTAVRDHGTHR